MSFSKILLTSALLLTSAPFATKAMAMDAPAVSKDAAAQPSGVYQIDPRHTSVIWKVWHMGVSHYTARFDKTSGTLNFDPKDPTKSKLDIAIETSSVNTGLPDFDKEIAGPKFLGGDKTPQIKFVSTKIDKTGDNTGKVTGELTLNGVSKPVTLDVIFNGAIKHPMKPASVLGFSGTTTIKRSDFNIVEYIPMIGDEVQITVDTEFLQDAPKNP